MIEVVPFSVGHLAEIEPLPEFAWLRPRLLRVPLSVHAMTRGWSFTMLADGRPVAAAGILPVADEAWAILSADTPPLATTRAARAALRMYPRPVLARVDPANRRAVRWVGAIGFRRRAAADERRPYDWWVHDRARTL